MILAAILDFVKQAEKHRKKFTGQISQGQYAYCKYLEIIRVGVFGYITKFDDGQNEQNRNIR